MAKSRARRVVVTVLAVLTALGGAALLLREPIRRLLVERLMPDYVAPVPVAHAKSRVRLAQVGKGFQQATDIQFVPGKPHLAVVLEKGGRARLLDVSKAAPGKPAEAGPVVFEVKVESASELGLLGLAFHPKYEENGRFFVNYNPSGPHQTVIAEWSLPPAELGKQPAREVRRLLQVPQPYPNHNAGQLAFGGDGFLYVGLGDGGFRDDPQGNGQNLGTLLGSMLRLDVDQPGVPYAVPKDNPFVGQEKARPEIWAYGLRNPWRFSFDPRGRMIVADVGQDRFEEIDIVQRGDNMGWKVREATHCFEPETGCKTKGLVDPIFEYGRELGTSVTGGYVYTGDEVPDLSGRYLFGDFTSGRIWALALPNPDIPSRDMAKAEELGQFPYLISTFGRDAAGEIYVADYAGGGVYRLAP